MAAPCPCDEPLFPPKLSLAAGLPRVPRQIATFPEYRAAMLRAIGGKGPLADWRARSPEDFGIMLLEFWAYLCDNLSFIDEFLVNELLLRCALDRASLRKLVGLLGYRARPAIAAQVDLALLLDGRRPVLIPPGTAFRSGAFPGSPPQLFETGAAYTLDPRNNQWQLLRKRPTTLGGSGWRTSLLLASGSARVKEGDIILVTGPSISFSRKLTRVSDSVEDDGERYKKVEWSGSAWISPSTPLSGLQIRRSSKSAGLWQKPTTSTTSIEALDVYYLDLAIFDAVYGEITEGSPVVLDREGDIRLLNTYYVIPIGIEQAAGTTTEVRDGAGKVTSTATSPPVERDLTVAFFDPGYNDPAVRGSRPTWDGTDAGAIRAHFSFQPAGDITVPYAPLLSPSDPLKFAGRIEPTIVQPGPAKFQLVDRDQKAQQISGSINYPNRQLIPSQGSGLTGPLSPEITVYGNIVRATRGETVPLEVLGIGDVNQFRQSFKLKKKPLTYLEGPAGAVSTLRVWVDGVQWTEERFFYGLQPGREAYIVRQDDDQVTTITFHGRLRSGAVVTASYRHGAGELSPPAGSIKQLARPAPGLRGARNPIPAFGGGDQEPASGLRVYAPRSALLLGRAISLPDMEAAAASTGGVRAARAGWRWNPNRQTPLVQMWYIGGAPVKETLLEKLRGLSDGVTPIDVAQAQPLSVQLALSIAIDPKRVSKDVIAAAGAALLAPKEGLLVPEHIGIGRALFRSRLFEALLDIPGVQAVDGLLWNGSAFGAFGKDPGAGKYFDFEIGSVTINGEVF